MQRSVKIRANAVYPSAVAEAPRKLSALPATDPLLILQTLDAVVYDWDLACDRLTWGPNVAATLAGLPEAALASGAGFAALVAGDSPSSRYQAIHAAQGVDEGQGASFRATYSLVSPDGVSLEVEDFGRWFADEMGRPRRAHGILRVLSRGCARTASQAVAPSGNETSFSARRSFSAWVDARCADMRPGGGSSAILSLGIVNLAAINRCEGYDAADDLILAVGRKLARSLRIGDRIVRYSGGKFALFLSLGSSDRLEEAALRLARAVGAEPFDTCAGPLNAQVRIGAALAPADGRNAHLLLQRAEQAYDDAEGSQKDFAAFSAHGAVLRGAATRPRSARRSARRSRSGGSRSPTSRSSRPRPARSVSRRRCCAWSGATAKSSVRRSCCRSRKSSASVRGSTSGCSTSPSSGSPRTGRAACP